MQQDKDRAASRRRALQLYFLGQGTVILGAAGMTALHSFVPMALAGSAGIERTRWLSRASDGSASPSTAEVRISNCATGSLQNARGTVYGSRSMVSCPARSCPSG